MRKTPQAKGNRARGALPRLAYNLQETAKILGLSQTSIYRLIERGKLRCCAELRHKVIPLASIEEFLSPKAE
jgi:DNA-binding XRE family transcriptional regulator